MKWHLFPQAASVRGKKQRQRRIVSHHLCLRDRMFSPLQIFLPGGKTDRKKKSIRFLLMSAHFENKAEQPREELMRFLPRRASTSGITTWSSCGRAATANSRTPT